MIECETKNKIIIKTNKPLNVYHSVPFSAGSHTRFEGDQMVFETGKKQMEIQRFLHFEISKEMQIKSHSKNSQVLNSVNSINTQNTRTQCKMMDTLL